MDNNKYVSYKNDTHNQKAKLIIITNKKYYFKSEIIEGNIILDCLSNITLREITISLYLKEGWIIQETSTTKYEEKNNQLLSKFDLGINKYLNDNNEIKNILPGRYVFPFKIELPNYLQPSFEYPMPNRTAFLRYFLESEIISNDMKIKQKYYLLIKGSSILLKTPKVFSSITNVHKWGMFDGGSTILKVSYKKNNYKIDEIVPLNIEIDNNRGKLKVKECKIRIIRTIEFKRLDKNSLEKYPLEKTIYSNVFWSEVLPNSKRSFLFQTELKDKDLIDFNYLGENNPYPNIKDINILLPSIEGSIIKCEYRIQVSLYFDSFVTSGYRPRVFLPILIVHQSQEDEKNLSNSQNENVINNKINDYNYSQNYICSDSSLLYDKNYLDINKENKNNIINKSYYYKENNENNKNNLYDRDNDMIKFSQIENEKNNSKNNNNNINKKPNYIELKEDSYYNINEI